MHERQKTNLHSLPMELQYRIRSELLRDPALAWYNFKRLRLVCKTFDAVWSPVILSSIHLFRLSPLAGYDDGICENLRQFVRAGINNPTLVKAVMINTWHYLSTRSDRCQLRIQQSGPKWVKRALSTLASIAVAPAEGIFKYLEKPGLSEARRNASILPRKLHLPNVHCAKMFIRHCENDWVLSRSMGLLFALPPLTELELNLSGYADIPYISHCLARISTLHKFKVVTHRSIQCTFPFKHDIDSLGVVISNNPNLTHLSFRLNIDTCNLSNLLQDIPADKPLNLEHLSLDCHFTLSDTTIPHIRSLKSFQYGFWRGSSSCTLLLAKAGIFPPRIETNVFDEELLTYLTEHPGIVHLTVTDVIDDNYRSLYRIMASHFRTLRSIAITVDVLVRGLKVIENEVDFLSCIHIRELVLYSHSIQPTHKGDQSYEHTRYIMPFIARLDFNLTLIIANNTVVYKLADEFCRFSENPLLRDLSKRIVLEERAGFPLRLN